MTRTELLPRDWPWFIGEIAFAATLCVLPILIVGAVTEGALRSGLVLASAFLIPAEFLRQFIGFEKAYEHIVRVLHRLSQAPSSDSAELFQQMASEVESGDRLTAMESHLRALDHWLGRLDATFAGVRLAQQELSTRVEDGQSELRTLIEALDERIARSQGAPGEIGGETHRPGWQGRLREISLFDRPWEDPHKSHEPVFYLTVPTTHPSQDPSKFKAAVRELFGAHEHTPTIRIERLEREPRRLRMTDDLQIVREFEKACAHLLAKDEISPRAAANLRVALLHALMQIHTAPPLISSDPRFEVKWEGLFKDKI